MLETVEDQKAVLQRGVIEEPVDVGIDKSFGALKGFRGKGVLKVTLGPEDYTRGRGRKTHLLLVKEEQYEEHLERIRNLSAIVAVVPPRVLEKQRTTVFRGIEPRKFTAILMLLREYYWVIPMRVTEYNGVRAYGLPGHYRRNSYGFSGRDCREEINVDFWHSAISDLYVYGKRVQLYDKNVERSSLRREIGRLAYAEIPQKLYSMQILQDIDGVFNGVFQ